MLELELYSQTYDFTAVFTLFITVLLGISINILWIVNVHTPIVESPYHKIQLKLSVAVLAYKTKTELTIDQVIILLKKIRLKLATDDDAFHFSLSR